MAEPYMGEIRIMANSYAPEGWAVCDGSMISIAGNETLFGLLGTTYGGDGQTDFGLPDLRGRLPVHLGAGLQRGQSDGAEQVTLQTPQLPVHNHLVLVGQNQASQPSPSGNVLAVTTSPLMYATIPAQPATPMSPQAIGVAGGGGAHDNMMPFLALNFMIALYGQYPVQN